jgi:hypothetical protein
MPTLILCRKIKETSQFETGRKSQKEEYCGKKGLQGIINAASQLFTGFPAS